MLTQNEWEAALGYYDAALICLNGHMVTDDATSEDASPRCADCGETTTSDCPACKSQIRGQFHYDHGMTQRGRRVKSYCYNCGEAYPWTARKTDGVMELANAIEDLTDNEKDNLRDLLPNLIEETPRTPAAGFKVLAIIQRAGPAAKALLQDAIVSVAVDAGKKAMGL